MPTLHELLFQLSNDIRNANPSGHDPAMVGRSTILDWATRAGRIGHELMFEHDDGITKRGLAYQTARNFMSNYSAEASHTLRPSISCDAREVVQVASAFIAASDRLDETLLALATIRRDAKDMAQDNYKHGDQHDAIQAGLTNIINIADSQVQKGTSENKGGGFVVSEGIADASSVPAVPDSHRLTPAMLRSVAATVQRSQAEANKTTGNVLCSEHFLASIGNVLNDVAAQIEADGKQAGPAQPSSVPAVPERKLPAVGDILSIKMPNGSAGFARVTHVGDDDFTWLRPTTSGTKLQHGVYKLSDYEAEWRHAGNIHPDEVIAFNETMKKLGAVEAGPVKVASSVSPDPSNNIAKTNVENALAMLVAAPRSVTVKAAISILKETLAMWDSFMQPVSEERVGDVLPPSPTYKRLRAVQDVLLAIQAVAEGSKARNACNTGMDDILALIETEELPPRKATLSDATAEDAIEAMFWTYDGLKSKGRNPERDSFKRAVRRHLRRLKVMEPGSAPDDQGELAAQTGDVAPYKPATFDSLPALQTLKAALQKLAAINDVMNTLWSATMTSPVQKAGAEVAKLVSEAKMLLTGNTEPFKIVADMSIPPGEVRMVQDGKIVQTMLVKAADESPRVYTEPTLVPAVEVTWHIAELKSILNTWRETSNQAQSIQAAINKLIAKVDHSPHTMVSKQLMDELQSDRRQLKEQVEAQRAEVKRLDDIQERYDSLKRWRKSMTISVTAGNIVLHIGGQLIMEEAWSITRAGHQNDADIESVAEELREKLGILDGWCGQVFTSHGDDKAAVTDYVLADDFASAMSKFQKLANVKDIAAKAVKIVLNRVED